MRGKDEVRLFCLDSCNHFGGAGVTLQDALQRTELWHEFVGELEQGAWESGFPEWAIYSSEELQFGGESSNMAGFDPFMVLSAARDMPDVVVVDTGVWIFIVRSDQSFWGERAGKEVGRISPILAGVPLKLVDPYIQEIPFVTDYSQRTPPSESAERCYALPRLLQDSLEIELWREAARRGSDDIRQIWEEILLEEMGW